MKRKPPKPVSHRKVSETVMDFAAPLLDRYGDAPTNDEMEQALQLVSTIWNAVVLDDANGNRKNVAMLNALTAGEPLFAELSNFLVDRKRRFSRTTSGSSASTN